MPQAPLKTQPIPWDLAYKPVPFNPRPQLQGQAPPAPPLNQEPAINEGHDLQGWGQYSEDQFNQSPGLKALRGLGQSDFSMPSMPDIPFASKDLQPPAQVPRTPVQNANGINGPATVTNPPRDIELPAEPDPFPDNPDSMVSLSESPYRQPIKPVQSSEQAISSLKGLRGAYQPSFDSSQNDNTNSQLYQLQKARQGELEERGANAHGFGDTQPGEIDRIKALLGPLNQDIQENPITTGIGEAEASRKAEQAAIGHGFKGGGVYQSGPNSLSSVEPTVSPSQQEAQFGQAAEMAKINSPVEQQKVQSQGQKDVETIRQKGAVDVQKQYTDLQRELANKAASEGRQVGTVSKTGISFQARPSINSLLNELTQARGQMERAKQGQDYISMNYITTGRKLPEELMFQQALSNAVSQTPGGAELDAYVNTLMQDPNVRDMPLDQLFTYVDQNDIGDGGQPMTDDEKNLLSNLVYSKRGH